MITQSNKQNKTDFILGAEFKSKAQTKNIIAETNHITNFHSNKQAIMFLGEKKAFTIKTFKKAVGAIFSQNQNYQIKVQDFITNKVSEEEITRVLVESYILNFGKVYTLKTAKKPKEKTFSLLGLTTEGKKQFNISKEEAQVRNWVRSFQFMPPNELNSVNFAEMIKKEFSQNKNVKVKILGKKEIQQNKMGLFLGVNAGSAFDPRLVVLEYLGNPKSKNKTALIGKGIMFDSGGYSLKPSSYMKTMKFDMSGAAIVAGAMKLVAKRKPKTNLTVLMALTDNLIGKTAQTVDSVQKSMSGKTVEINNTDAEGRLVVADAMTYAAKKLKATKLVTVATLTGAVVVALGNEYTGVWTTEDKDWDLLNASAKTKDERVWRMPLDSDFVEGFKTSKIADLYNTNYDSQAGSSAAAGFLQEFREKLPFIHFDIAGTAEIKNIATGVMVKTLADFTSNLK